MTFVSYAQNFEDVMLWRALRHVDGGFYIDVGAADPDQGSVTRAFYDLGWRGINIEPEPDYAAALRMRRPEDVNLEVAVGASPGQAVLRRISGTGLSTFDEQIAADHAKAGYPEAEPLPVAVRTLSDIWQAHAPSDVHFLKIDAEGSERDVLLGADLMHQRPWIIVVEATEPFSPTKKTEAFEDLLLAAGYRFRWFDGLNAWYVAAEHDDELRGAFETPPNYFDDFVMGNFLAEAGRADMAEAAYAEAERLRSAAILRIAALEDAHRTLERGAQAAEAAYELVDAGRRQALERVGELEEALRALESLVRTVEAAYEQTEAGRVQALERVGALEDGHRALESHVRMFETAYGQTEAGRVQALDRVAALEHALQLEERRALAAEAALGRTETARQALEVHLQGVEGKLNAILGSRSWRLIQRLRRVPGLARRG
jgi:FkbM family methyltransferase